MDDSPSTCPLCQRPGLRVYDDWAFCLSCFRPPRPRSEPRGWRGDWPSLRCRLLERSSTTAALLESLGLNSDCLEAAHAQRLLGAGRLYVNGGGRVDCLALPFDARPGLAGGRLLVSFRGCGRVGGNRGMGVGLWGLAHAAAQPPGDPILVAADPLAAIRLWDRSQRSRPVAVVALGAVSPPPAVWAAISGPRFVWAARPSSASLAAAVSASGKLWWGPVAGGSVPDGNSPVDTAFADLQRVARPWPQLAARWLASLAERELANAIRELKARRLCPRNLFVALRPYLPRATLRQSIENWRRESAVTRAATAAGRIRQDDSGWWRLDAQGDVAEFLTPWPLRCRADAANDQLYWQLRIDGRWREGWGPWSDAKVDLCAWYVRLVGRFGGRRAVDQLGELTEASLRDGVAAASGIALPDDSRISTVEKRPRSSSRASRSSRCS